MTKKMVWMETAGVASIIIVIVGLPLLLWYWQAVFSLRKYPAGSKVIDLTAVAQGGIWTQDRVAGYNYWWKTPARTPDIQLNQGEHVVVRLHSPDVLHSFSIPLMHIQPVDMPAGHTEDVEFDATRPGELTFLCYQVCGPDHHSLLGRFQVKGNGKSENDKESW
jgi:heme/copper-type cytochrome/quinol oxidase subunit 2